MPYFSISDVAGGAAMRGEYYKCKGSQVLAGQRDFNRHGNSDFPRACCQAAFNGIAKGFGFRKGSLPAARLDSLRAVCAPGVPQQADDRWKMPRDLSDIAFDAVLETGIRVQAQPLRESNLKRPAIRHRLKYLSSTQPGWRRAVAHCNPGSPV